MLQFPPEIQLLWNKIHHVQLKPTDSENKLENMNAFSWNAREFVVSEFPSFLYHGKKNKAVRTIKAHNRNWRLFGTDKSTIP